MAQLFKSCGPKLISPELRAEDEKKLNEIKTKEDSQAIVQEILDERESLFRKTISKMAHMVEKTNEPVLHPTKKKTKETRPGTEKGRVDDDGSKGINAALDNKGKPVDEGPKKPWSGAQYYTGKRFQYSAKTVDGEDIIVGREYGTTEGEASTSFESEHEYGGEGDTVFQSHSQNDDYDSSSMGGVSNVTTIKKSMGRGRFLKK